MKPSVSKVYQLRENDDRRRFDRVVRKMFPALRLGHVYTLIRKGKIGLNGKKVHPSTKVTQGEWITVSQNDILPEKQDTSEMGRHAGSDFHHPHREKNEADTSNTPPSKIIKPLIIHENHHILALNKPAGVLVHGPDSLEREVLRYLEPTQTPSLSFRPGPLHRLDRNTSGILFFSKSLEGAICLSRILREGGAEKTYLALMDGKIDKPDEITWEDSLVRNFYSGKTVSNRVRGKTAVTIVRPIFHRKNLTLALCIIPTGRTHQIRAQAAIHHHPLTGDRKYGGSSLVPAFLLHAAAFNIKKNYPVLGFRRLTAPLPPIYHTVVAALLGEEALKKAAYLLKGGESSF